MIKEFDKYTVADIIETDAVRKGVKYRDIVEVTPVGGGRCPFIELRTGTRRVRISVRESGKRKYADRCWVGIAFKDFKRLKEAPESFIVVAERLRGDYIVVPLNLAEPYLRPFRGGRSLIIRIEDGNYRLGRRDGPILAVNDLRPIFEPLCTRGC